MESSVYGLLAGCAMSLSEGFLEPTCNPWHYLLTLVTQSSAVKWWSGFVKQVCGDCLLHVCVSECVCVPTLHTQHMLQRYERMTNAVSHPVKCLPQSLRPNAHFCHFPLPYWNQPQCSPTGYENGALECTYNCWKCCKVT